MGVHAILIAQWTSVAGPVWNRDHHRRALRDSRTAVPEVARLSFAFNTLTFPFSGA